MKQLIRVLCLMQAGGSASRRKQLLRPEPVQRAAQRLLERAGMEAERLGCLRIGKCPLESSTEIEYGVKNGRCLRRCAIFSQMGAKHFASAAGA